MQRRQTNRWVYVPLLGLLGAVAGCSAPSQFVLELGADGGVVDVPLQFVPDRGVVVDVSQGDVVDVGQPPDGQVVDVEHADAVTADAADGGALDVPASDVALDATVDAAQPDAAQPDVVDVSVADVAADVVQLDVVDAGADGAREDRPDAVDVPVVDTPPAPCRRNTDCPTGQVCAFHGGDAGGTQVCEPPRGRQEGEACVLDRECQSGFCTDIGCARPCITTSDCAGATVRVDAGPLVCRPGASSTVLNCYQCPGCAS